MCSIYRVVRVYANEENSDVKSEILKILVSCDVVNIILILDGELSTSIKLESWLKLTSYK